MVLQTRCETKTQDQDNSDSASSKMWIIPSEFTEALKGISGAFAARHDDSGETPPPAVDTHPAAPR